MSGLKHKFANKNINKIYIISGCRTDSIDNNMIIYHIIPINQDHPDMGIVLHFHALNNSSFTVK
jgi:hypothetical protein